MPLKSTINRGTLSVNGAAASASGFDRVELLVTASQTTLEDNGPAGSPVPVSGDGSPIRSISVAGLTGAGAEILSLVPGVRSVVGSAQDDVVTVLPQGSVNITGGSGSDVLTTGRGDDILVGGEGFDTLNGGFGDDRLNGGVGNDLINGNGGFDTAAYAGSRADYLVIVHGGLVSVTGLDQRRIYGTDTLANVERLQFNDGFLDVPALTSLTAEVVGGSLVVTGVGASSDSNARIGIRATSNELYVSDNGAIRIDVPVTEDGSAIRTIDARGVSGAGTTITADFAGSFFGSAQSDWIFATVADGLGRVVIDGGAGSDRLETNAATSTLFGRGGNDIFFGGAGRDKLNGGFGNDTISGGEGIDTAVYLGDRSDYSVTVQDGVFVVTDLRERSPEGTDQVRDVERLQFRDAVLELPDSPTLLEARVEDGVLSVSGPAASTAAGALVSIYLSAGGTTVDDAGARSVDVPVESDGSSIQAIDLRELDGAGAYVFAAASSPLSTIRGSAQNDWFSIYNPTGAASGVVADGGAGSDRILVSAGSSTLFGRGGDDTLTGGASNDRLHGGYGSDLLDGGGGTDTAVYLGSVADYEVAAAQGGGYVVRDLRVRSPEGYDQLSNIEQLQFSDGLLVL